MTRLLLAAALLALSAAAAAGGNPAAGKAKASTCVACHGANGEGIGPSPALAGKRQDDLLAALGEYKSGKRTNATMKKMAGKLKNDEDMADVCAYFASLKKQ